MENLIETLGTLDYHSKNEGKETAYQISTKRYFVKDGEGLSPIGVFEETIFNYDLKDFIHSNDNILSLVSSLRHNLVESTVNSRINHEESMSKPRSLTEKAQLYVISRAIFGLLTYPPLQVHFIPLPHLKKNKEQRITIIIAITTKMVWV